MSRWLLPFFCLAPFAAVCAAEPPWGGLKARIVYDGPPPERAKLLIDKDMDFCGKIELRDESLLVDKDGGLANVLVWLERKEAMVAVHPSFEKSAKDKVPIDTRGCRFVPHVSFMRTTQTLALRNSDPIANHAKLEAMKNDLFSRILKSEGTVELTLDKPERLPGRLTSSIHTWQSAYLFVVDHPYVAVSDARGNVELANVPEGKWTFVFWHERSGYLRSVEKGGAKVEWPKGRVDIEIKPGPNDVGEIKVKPEIFPLR